MTKSGLSELPYFADDFLTYMETIKGKSENTVKEYFYDLRLLFRFIKVRKGLLSPKYVFDDILVSDFTLDLLRSISLTDLYAFMNYINTERHDKATTRARKVASIRSFYKYMQTKARLIENNPALELESPKIMKKLPRYLNIDESKNLLNIIKGQNKARDLAIITLFLNCGLRLSELVNININDIHNDSLTVIGKGSKERTIYLNNACLSTLSEYLIVRRKIEIDDNALFLSERKQRISNKTVQYTVKKYIGKAGLDKNKYSTHKLRHTAATLMYQHGDVDIRALQEILGHESIATTEIYTHVDSKRLREAVSRNPLSDFEPDN